MNTYIIQYTSSSTLIIPDYMFRTLSSIDRDHSIFYKDINTLKSQISIYTLNSCCFSVKI